MGDNMKKSIWQKDNNIKEEKGITENLTTDVLIIGAGMTGISLAYNLIDGKNNIIMVDAGKIADATTAKSTGKVTYLQDLTYYKICNVYDFDTAKLYYESQKEAIRIINRNVKNNKIECDLKKCEMVTFTNDEKEVPKFTVEKLILDRLGVKYSNVSKNIKNNDVKELISVNDGYVFNPVKYLIGLYKKIRSSSNVDVYMNSRVQKVQKTKEGFKAYVNGFEIKCKKIVFACHYPFFTIPGFIPLKTYVEKSYIAASKVEKTSNVAAITSNYPYVSFRYQENKKEKYFIYLNNSSKLCSKLNHEKNYEECTDEIKKITGTSPTYKWENMDLLTNDYLPLIGRVSKDEKNAFIATGYNTWGMTGGTIAGKIIADLINSKDNKYLEVFNPSRSMNFKKVLNFTNNTLLSNLKAYGFNFIKKNPSWYKNQAFVTRYCGKRVGVYYDEEGKEHVVSNVCPHLKCFLTFNKVDKTWDCPCHGSRFDTEGNVVKGPSSFDIKIDETKL